MKCPSCGLENPDATMMCRDCGYNFRPFEPKALSYEDRFLIAGLVACLVNVTGVHAEREREFLEGLFKHLGLPDPDREALRRYANGRYDPTPFASAISEQRARWMILWDLVVLASVTGSYDARDREGLRRIAKTLGIPWHRVVAAEDEIAIELRKEFHQGAKKSTVSPARWWKIAAATLAGGAALAATGGLAAPAIGGAIGTYFMGL